MKTFALCLALVAAANADVIQLNNGSLVSGRVTGLTAGVFDVVESSNKTTKIPAVAVVGVDFLRGVVPAVLDLSDKSQLTGKAWLYARGALNFEDAGGETKRILVGKIAKATFGEQPPAPPDPKKPAAPAIDNQAGNEKVKVIAHGDRVDIAKYCVAGKVTVVDFYAEWCGPCRQVGPVLERDVNNDADLVLRKIDIVQWSTPVTQQYNINSVPTIQVYDRKGKLVGQLSGFNEDRFRQLLKQAKAS